MLEADETQARKTGNARKGKKKLGAGAHEYLEGGAVLAVAPEAVDGVEDVSAVHGAAVGHPPPHGRAHRGRPLHPLRQRGLLSRLIAGPLRRRRRPRRRLRRRRGGVASGASEESCDGDGDSERRPPAPEQRPQQQHRGGTALAAAGEHEQPSPGHFPRPKPSDRKSTLRKIPKKLYLDRQKLCELHDLVSAKPDQPILSKDFKKLTETFELAYS